MDGKLTEQLVTAAQRLQLAEWERLRARDCLETLVREHRDQLSVAEAQRLTLLPMDVLERLLGA